MKKEHVDLFAGIVGMEDATRVSSLTLRHLATLQVSELVFKYGLTESGAKQMAATAKLASAIASEPEKLIGQQFVRADQVFHHFRERLGKAEQEQFWIVLLDGKHRGKREIMVSQGTLTSSPVHPREVFREAIKDSSAAIILCHNHPSGDPEPSNDDISVTERLRSAGEIVGIHILDHVIIGDNRFVSLSERGFMS